MLPNLTSIDVAANNTHYSSYNGALLDAAKTSLLLIPEGMEGTAVLPDTLAAVPACVFSRCTKLMAISVANTGSAASSAYAAQDGILYTNDLSSLIAAPAGIGA
ncbi:hypothetical protein, partial [Adlercreutzia sp. ZJ304]